LIKYDTKGMKKALKNKTIRLLNRYTLIVGAGVGVVIIIMLLGSRIYANTSVPDKQCTTSHTTNSKPPKSLKTADDYFLQGDYDYDLGNCKKAIRDYTKAIELNPEFAQAYNNRAYTNMRMQNYKDALPDLNKAIDLKPNYSHALMNRGDIYNFYYNIDKKKAVADYDAVVRNGNTKDTNACGHRLIARDNGNLILPFLRLFTGDSDLPIDC